MLRITTQSGAPSAIGKMAATALPIAFTMPMPAAALARCSTISKFGSIRPGKSAIGYTAKSAKYLRLSTPDCESCPPDMPLAQLGTKRAVKLMPSSTSAPNKPSKSSACATLPAIALRSAGVRVGR